LLPGFGGIQKEDPKEESEKNEIKTKNG